jgi:hypothetical protein
LGDKKTKGSKPTFIEIMRIQLNIRKKLLAPTYSMKNLASSVGDPGCLSRILIFINSRILDLGSQIQQQQKGKRKFFCLTSFEATNFTKLKIILFLNRYRQIF